jgi:hypothetical protein
MPTSCGTVSTRLAALTARNDDVCFQRVAPKCGPPAFGPILFSGSMDGCMILSEGSPMGQEATPDANRARAP